MTSVIWRIRHTNFFVFLCSPIDAVVHLHEDDSILEVFRLDSVLLHRHLAKQMHCCVSKNFHSNTTNSPSIQSYSRYSWDFWNHTISPSKLLLVVDIHEFCQDKEPNQRKRVHLLSTTWPVVFLMFLHFDSITISVKYGTTIWHVRNQWMFLVVRTSSWQSCPKLFRGIHNCWHKHSPDHRVNIDFWHIVSKLTTQCLSFVRLDFLKMANDVPGNFQVAVRKVCTNGTVCRFQYWCSDLHLKATPENWKLCFHSDLASGLPELVWSTFELSALSVTKAVKCTRTECYWRPIDKLRYYAPHCFLISQPHVPLLLVFRPVSASSTWC